MPDNERSSRRPVDARALTRMQRRLAAAPAPWLHTEVARRMAERLPVIRLQPTVLLDWWASSGGGHGALRAQYPQARIVAVETAPPTPEVAPWWSPRRWRDAAEVQQESAVAAAGAQMLWANMMLHGVPDPQLQMAAWQRALAVDGCLMFSTLGPGSLQGLRDCYRDQGWPIPHAPFVDMHDLGDMLVHAGFADPVMDQEQIVLTWPDTRALLAELRSLGGNAALARHAGLRTPRWRDRLQQSLRGLAGADGRPQLAFELVYGHAFKPPPRPRLQAETRVDPEDLRTLARRPRTP